MFVKLTNGNPSKFPYTLGELRRDNPNTSFPKVISDETLAAYDVARVTPTAPPTIDTKTHTVTQWVEKVDAVWTQTWRIDELPKEQAANNVRNYRDRLLQESDWTQLPDAPVDHQAWATYRQALRDVTDQQGFPWNVNWPTEPAS